MNEWKGWQLVEARSHYYCRSDILYLVRLGKFEFYQGKVWEFEK